ncbi:hypothetical protein H0H87_002122 [Tephrocybe sp. NHM501043]|nr:hypothetical protein H0H87_002122 [Tephrocybe sp. NHM501043]
MYIRRAVIPASPEESDVTPTSNLALLPLLSLSVVVLILIFFAVRIFRRSLYLPSFSWLRGKGQGTKGRLGLSGVELLPTSFKAIPTLNQSPYAVAFNLEGNASKDGSSSLLSRSSSLDTLPQLSTSSPAPHLTSRRHSYSRPPFSLPGFLKTKHKPSHRRSRSLGVPHRNTSSSMPISAPSTPSPKTLLIDFSTSNSSTSTSASSDLGTHKLYSASSPPLIPGLPIPTASPAKARTLPKTSANIWTFDVEDEGDDIADSHVADPLLAAFKHSHPQPQAKPQEESMPLIQYEDSSPPLPPIASMVPKRLGTNNPFASIADSFSSPADRHLSPSPPALSPSPPGIELVPIKVTEVHPTDLVDFGDDELEPSTGSQASPVIRVVETPKRLETETEAFAVSIATPDLATEMNEMHEATEIGPAAPSEEVSDPFDDSHAIKLPNQEWTIPAPPSPVEQTHPPLVEQVLPNDPLDNEPTAVWDASWTVENVKGDVLFETGHRKGKDEEDEEDEPEFNLDRAREIDVLDELLAGPSEPIQIHIFEEMAADSVPEDPTHHNDQGDTAPVITTPLLSTPATPNTSLPNLPSPTPVVITLIPAFDDYSDPEFPPTVISPIVVSPAPVKVHLPQAHPAQTPTPPASPPPPLNVTGSRPLWSLRAADAPPLGLPAASAPASPSTPALKEEAKLSMHVDSPTSEPVSPGNGLNVLVDGNIAGSQNTVATIDGPTNSASKHEEEPSTRTTTPEPATIALPGSFPTSPSPPAPVTLPIETTAPSSLKCASTTVQTRTTLPPPRNRLRAPRSAIDIALAMQLRPGLGAGADPAWMVRFLMATLGWFAILVSGDL